MLLVARYMHGHFLKVNNGKIDIFTLFKDFVLKILDKLAIFCRFKYNSFRFHVDPNSIFNFREKIVL